MALAEVTTPEWTLGDRLAKARRHAGMDQADMAKILGCSRTTLSTWERDEAQPRDFLGTMERWSEATGVDRAWLLGFRTGSFATLEGLPPSESPELPFPPPGRQLAAVAG